MNNNDPRPEPVYQYAVLPAKVGMAMNVLSFFEGVKQGNPSRYTGEPMGGRELSDDELEVYDSALTVMLRYFESADNDFQPHGSGQQKDGGEPHPQGVPA